MIDFCDNKPKTGDAIVDAIEAYESVCRYTCEYFCQHLKTQVSEQLIRYRDDKGVIRTKEVHYAGPKIERPYGVTHGL